VLLGMPSQVTFYNWKRGYVAGIPADTLERISYIMGICKALGILFPNRRQADDWGRTTFTRINFADLLR